MYIDKGKPIFGLVQIDVTGLVGDTIVDCEAGVVFHVNNWEGSSGAPSVCKIFFDHLLLVVVVDDILAVAEQTEGSHLVEEDEVDTGTYCKEGVLSTAVFTFD